jgi:hypothetical protein
VFWLCRYYAGFDRCPWVHGAAKEWIALPLAVIADVDAGLALLPHGFAARADAVDEALG